MTTKTTSRPTHRVYAVTKKRDGESGHWVEIGAAWPHKDGKGFNVKLKLLPLNTETDIVIREARAEGSAQ